MNSPQDYSKVNESDLSIWLEDSKEHLIILIFISERFGSVQILRDFLKRIKKDKPYLIVYWINIEPHKDLVLDLGVTEAPTIILLRNSEMVEFVKGILPRHKLLELIEEYA